MKALTLDFLSRSTSSLNPRLPMSEPTKLEYIYVLVRRSDDCARHMMEVVGLYRSQQEAKVRRSQEFESYRTKLEILKWLVF